MSTNTKLAEALRLGREGAPATEEERLLFEAWMRGHCWALCATWDGKQYVSDAEQGGYVDPRAMNTRQIFAAWRDRAALAAHDAEQAAQPDRDELTELMDHAFNDGREGLAEPSASTREAEQRFRAAAQAVPAGMVRCPRCWEMVTVPAAPAPEAAKAVPATEFCWLVELFDPNTDNSLGDYHTGFTDLAGESRSTKDPLKAQRYGTKEAASRAAFRLKFNKVGIWRAVEHGFMSAPAAPALQAKAAGQELPDTEAVTACWQDFGRTGEFRRAVKWSQDGEIPGALFVAFRAGLCAASPKSLCDCGKKPAAECDKWEPGCDLGHSPEHARVVRLDVKTQAAGQELPPHPLPQAEFDALMDHIHEYGTMAEGITTRALKLCDAYARAAMKGTQ